MMNRRLGHYRIVEKIGSGGMGEVYRARDERLERDVALKMIFPAMLAGEFSRKRFRQEALTLSKLNHPNIAIVHDFDSEEGVDFLVMEYISGTSLADRLVPGALVEKDVLLFGAQIASALEEAQERGVIHRDLKPGNILITPKNQVKVLDFGLAHLFKPATDVDVTAMHTQVPASAGTLPYMSPEQLRGEKLDPRSDIFAFGDVLYEMATGRRAFPENQGPRLIDSVLNRPPVDPSKLNPNISRELERIILKCLEKDPQDRYQSSREISVDLRRLSTSSSATVTRAMPPAVRYSKRKRILGGLAAAAVVVAVVIGFNFASVRNKLTFGTRTDEISAVVALPSKVYGAAEESFLSDAIPNTLSSQLAHVPGLLTKMPPSSLDVQQMGGDLGRIAVAYDVKAVITSSVTVDANRLVLAVQIVEPNTRRVLWSQEYEGQRGVYIDIVRQAAEGVRAAVRPSAQPVAAASASAGRSQGELAFQLGAYYGNLFVNTGKVEYFDRAVTALKQCLDLDPRRSDAAGRIASLYADKVVAGAPLQEVFPQASEWADRALKIDPHASRAWAVLANLETTNPAGSQRKALEYALKAVSANSQDTYALQRLVGILSRDSYILATDTSRQASGADPLVMIGPVFEALADSVLANYDQASARIDDALRLNPDFPFGLQTKVLALTMADRRQGEIVQILPQLDKLASQRRLHPDWVAFAHSFVDFARAGKARDTASMEAAMQRLSKVSRGESPFPRWQTITIGVAPLLARYGKRDAAISLLNWRGDAGVPDAYDVLLFQPDLKPILGDIAPALIASRARFDDAVGILQEARLRGELPGFLDQSLKDLLGRVAAASARK